MKLVEDGIQTYPDIAYIAGMASAAEGGMRIMREMNRYDIGLIAHYMTPGMHKGIVDGTVMGAITDSTVMQVRMAIDQAVRILEGYDYIKDTGPEIFIVDGSNVNTYDRDAMLPPKGWDPIFKVD